MPIGEIAGEVLGGIIRFVASFLFEVFFEILIKGTGYGAIRFVRPRAEPGERSCAWAGIALWAVVIVLGILVYRYIAGS